MGWATIDWPPKSGTTLKPKPRLYKRLLKPLAGILAVLLILMTSLLYITWKYGGTSWPYPANLVQNQIYKFIPAAALDKGEVVKEKQEP
ncbi:hypothetical protein JOC37_001564 [Desulfohalotomaculum tongense]|uniref:hypothetical protein n=1 Tax=Desulforadius tongensis TaxID=1216062 RepID=UPI001958C704|nr:hypothetical protein [Desulforadius tongensis]MBM7855179.1 hypothetical protein [Desulforadius tongensis]